MDQPPPVKPPRGVKHTKETVGSQKLFLKLYVSLPTFLEWSFDVSYSSPISM